MIDLLENFIDSLREELKHYGELLALLDLQQEQVIRRLADELLLTVSHISSQGDVIQAARREREQRQRELARSFGLGDNSLIADLTPRLRESYRLLVTALVDENNELLVRVRQRAQQNHVLLSRSVELMEQFICSLYSVGAPVYNGSGIKTAPTASGHAIYEAVG